jgi:hypothetical protein
LLFFFTDQRRQQLFSTLFSSAALLLQLETKKEKQGKKCKCVIFHKINLGFIKGIVLKNGKRIIKVF